MRLIDSHAHLDFDKYDADRSAVLARAAAAGVDTLLTIGTDLASSRRALALATAADEGVRIFASAGVHPHQADAFDDAHWPDLVALFADPRVRAVGETGLDYYYDFSDRGRQQVLFERHLRLCGEVQRPVVVHIRDGAKPDAPHGAPEAGGAFDDVWRLTRAVGLPAGGVVHCFTGGPAECEAALALGYHVSISGIATFKTAQALRSAVALIPDDRLLIETDSPFLAPIPHRGKRNEPAFVAQVAHEVARLRAQPVEHVAKVSRENAIRLFGLPV